MCGDSGLDHWKELPTGAGKDPLASSIFVDIVNAVLMDLKIDGACNSITNFEVNYHFARHPKP